MSKLNNSTVGELAAAVVGAAIAEKRSSLRVVEIGAGTGGTTSQIAPRIAKILREHEAQCRVAGGSAAARTELEYMFTDVSEAFLNAARPRFAQYPFIDFKTLDAERDMMKQGWSLRSADLVCAANVIHATRDLRNTLTRVRRLLVHGGVLILYELTSPSHYMDATVGLTSGWWEFDDYELRPEYALLSPERWGSFLAELGFETPQIFTPEMGSTKHSVSSTICFVVLFSSFFLLTLLLFLFFSFSQGRLRACDERDGACAAHRRRYRRGGAAAAVASPRRGRRRRRDLARRRGYARRSRRACRCLRRERGARLGSAARNTLALECRAH